MSDSITDTTSGNPSSNPSGKIEVNNITESMDDVLESKVSPSSSSNEKSGNTSSTSTTSISSVSSTKLPQKQPFASPPLRAFQTLPLSSGTIHPPSFTTPSKQENQIESPSVKGVDTVQSAEKDEDDDNTNKTNEAESTSGSLSTQTKVANYGSMIKVKGIDEYLPSNNDDSLDNTDDAKENLTKKQGHELEVITDRSNEEAIQDKPKLDATPKIENTATQTEIEEIKGIEARVKTISSNEGMKKQISRKSSEGTIQMTNTTKTSIHTENSNRLVDGSKVPFDDNDDSIASSASNSNSRSLLPRSLDLSTGDESNGYLPNSFRGRGFVDIGSGSILSSQDSSSKESRGRIVQSDMTRMKHLGMLLDRHHQQIKSRRRNNAASEAWWQNDDDSSIEKDFASASSKDRNSIGSTRGGVKSAESIDDGPISMNSSDGSNAYRSKQVLTTGFGRSVTETFSDASISEATSKSRFGRRNSFASVDSSQDQKNKKNNDSLFENFDKTWQSFHEKTDVGHDTAIAREQICFASMVLVLLQQIPRRNPDVVTYWSKSVPIEIVKLFWEEVIFSKADDGSDCSIKLPLNCDVQSTTEKISDSLLNKLRYISLDTDVQTSQSSEGDTSTFVKLSHDVYAEYSKHILKKYKLLPENCVNSWNTKFVSYLKNMIEFHFTSDETPAKCSQQVLMFAASHIPKLLLLSIHPEISDIMKSKDDELLRQQENRIDYFISLMKDGRFLSQRMKILGSSTLGKNVLGDSNLHGLRKGFKSESYIDRIDIDVLKATRVHIEDLESINMVLTMVPKETLLSDKGVVLDITDVILSLYKAWKELCLSLLHQDLPSETPQSNQFDTSKPGNYDHVTPNSGPMIQSSEGTQKSIPKCYRLDAGEYELNVSGLIAKIKKNDSCDTGHPENKRRSRFHDSRGKSSATMRLSHVLEIDPVHLYRYLSIGKSINLLGESVFEATFYTAENRPNSEGLKSLLGTSPNLTSVNFIISAIDIYMNLTHLMSFILSSDIGDVDEDDLIDMGYRYDKNAKNLDPSLRMRKLLEDRTEARLMFEKLNILCAESWLALGTYLLLGIAEGYADAIATSGMNILNRIDVNDIRDVDPSSDSQKEESEFVSDHLAEDDSDNFKYPIQSKILLCFQMALGVLLHNTSFVHEGNASFKADLKSVVVYARNLRASIIHSIGVHYYEQVCDYQRAKIYLDSSLGTRRLLLRLLQREDPEELGSLSGSSMNRGYRRRYQSHSRRANTRQKNKPKLRETQNQKKSRIDVILNFEVTRKKQISIIEKGLSTTLEFSALASHCMFDYNASLSFFQEALILRALHSGKHSLEVASLQYNMGVVHDDLAQYEASLGRYGESLRVRFSLMEDMKENVVFEPPFNSSALEFFDLEATVILTLRCMGNVYRALKDATNAIGCLMKAIELLKEKLKRGVTDHSSGLYKSADGDLGFGKGMGVGLPMPKVSLDELNGDEDASKLYLANLKDSNKQKIQGNEDDDIVRREISSMYKTIISLLHERAAQRSTFKAGVKSGYTSSASSYTSRKFSKPTRLKGSSTSKDEQGKKVLDANSGNDSIHLDSAFNLGLLSLHFGEQKSALNYFEDALRTLWTTFSGESSGESSDSDFSKSSRSRASKKQRPKKVYFEGQVEEGALYHALAIAHASLSDHERAVRCYVTALRYYRRRFGLECRVVAGALYDCAFSYWNINDNDRAEDFWADCLKILLCDGDKEENSSPQSIVYDLHVARTLYNLAAAKICKGEYNNPYINTCLNDATSIFQRLPDKETQSFDIEIGHCSYYSGYLHYKKALDTKLCGDASSEDLNLKKEYLNHALTCIDNSLNNYLTKRGNLDIGLEDVEVGQKLQHPMQAHIAHLTAWVHDSLGSVTQAQWNYKLAIRLLNKIYSPDNLFSASAMHSLANLYMLTGNSQEALNHYKDSLVLRAKILGSDHTAVADTLFQMAGIIGNTQNYTKAYSMFSHCLRIRMLTEGNNGEKLAETLLNLALLHDRNGYCRKAQECLEGALRIRRSRLQSIIHSCIANVEQAVENVTDDIEVCVQKRTKEEQIKLAYIMHNLGNVLLKIGDISEALKFFSEALDLRRKLIGIDEGGFAMFVGKGDFESAVELNHDILRDMADTLHNLGGVYESKCMQQKALSCYNQALIIKRSTSKEKQVEFSLDDHIKSCNTLSSAFTLLRIGAIHNDLHDHDVSLSYYKSAMSIQKQHLGRDHISIAQTLVDMGLTLRRQIENLVETEAERIPLEQAANKYFNEALRISKLCHGPNHVSVAGIMYHIGSMYDQGGNYSQAINHYQHSVKVYGREYAKTLCRNLFSLSAVQRNKYDYIVDSDHGLFHPISLRNNLLPIENNTSVVFRGVGSNSGRVADIERDAYLRVSLALAQATTRSGFIWFHGSSFQNFVLRILHFISTNGVDPIRDTLQSNIAYLMNHFAKASTHAVITVKDVPQSNYLYLITD